MIQDGGGEVPEDGHVSDQRPILEIESHPSPDVVLFKLREVPEFLSVDDRLPIRRIEESGADLEKQISVHPLVQPQAQADADRRQGSKHQGSG